LHQKDLVPNGSYCKRRCAQRIVPQKTMTIFPQSWLGTLLYSYAMNGNGHVIIQRHRHIQEQYDQGDIEYVSLCLYGRRTHIRPGSSYHGTVL
jgi:hypothetical protein